MHELRPVRQLLVRGFSALPCRGACAASQHPSAPTLRLAAALRGQHRLNLIRHCQSELGAAAKQATAASLYASWRRTWTHRGSPARLLDLHASPTSILSPAHAGCTVLPNPSLKLTRYGMRCKPGPRHMVHHRSPGLQRTPPRAA
jgi:hypothetical protein